VADASGLAERFVRHATAPGGLVLDPFAGTGTFLVAAARLGRRAMGCEVADKMVATCERRGCRVVSCGGRVVGERGSAHA